MSHFFALISMFLISKRFPLAVKFIRRFFRRIGRNLTDRQVRGFSRKVDCFRVGVKIDERDIVKLSLLRFFNVLTDFLGNQ